MWLSLLHIWSKTCYAWKICFYVKNPIYAKFYPCFMILMVSSHIYMFCFSKLVHVPHIYIYILLALHQNLLNINFLGSFQSFQNCQDSFHRTCPAYGPDISRCWASSLYKGAERPLRTVGSFFSSTPSLAVAKGSLDDFGFSALNPFGF
jgi:hypothetical protein